MTDSPKWSRTWPFRKAWTIGYLQGQADAADLAEVLYKFRTPEVDMIKEANSTPTIRK